ncbi:hypothetical protein AEM42_01595 [Betaproteobacteria bacterium UKL13-2]|nr:hypothetical protein AEM42_01595 [Betaproteobacteria bacterium UKL13-2]HCG53527.1 hypothetical protein [Betaproteobacteria bacterium]
MQLHQRLQTTSASLMGAASKTDIDRMCKTAHRAPWLSVQITSAFVMRSTQSPHQKYERLISDAAIVLISKRNCHVSLVK